MQKTYIDKLAYIYLKNDMILTTLSHGKDTRYIPGGKRENEESDYEASTREVKEELNVDLVPETIKHLWYVRSASPRQARRHCRADDLLRSRF